MRIQFLLLFLSFVLQNDNEEFLKNLKSHCGKSYEGKVIFPEGNSDPFAGKKLLITFQNCTDKEIRIPFEVGEDKSRTWIVTPTKDGMLLKHDHRHEDGTPDEITMYGGESIQGSALEQTFPADAYTANLIPQAAKNEWTLRFSADKKVLSYILKRDGALRFQADFNLE
jgi:hypothetical protein